MGEKLSTPMKKKKFLEIYEKLAGNAKEACKGVNIARATYYQWRDKDKKFKLSVEEIDEGLIDFAESKLMGKISEGDTTSTIFFLKTKGRERGYVERQEIEDSREPQLPAVINVKVHK